MDVHIGVFQLFISHYSGIVHLIFVRGAPVPLPLTACFAGSSLGCNQVGNQAFLTARRTLYIVILDLSYTPPVVVDGSGLADVEWGEEEELQCLKSYVNTLMTHVPSCVLVLVGTKVRWPSRGGAAAV